MEVAARTDADKKGGHLATSLETGGLTLRESAQCPKEDEPAFQDITKYTYFNTDNLWVDLLQLKDAFDHQGDSTRDSHGSCNIMLRKRGSDPRSTYTFRT